MSEDSTDTREAILDAAREVFRDVGFNGATMVRIAVRAGISYAQLLDEFSDKDALLQELLRRRDDEDDERTDLDSITDPHAALEALVGLVEHNAQQRGIIELFTVLVGESVSPKNPGHRFFQERYERRLESLRRTYERGRDAGVLNPEWEPDSAARELVALLDGLQIQWLLADGELDMAAIVRRNLARQIREPAGE